MKDHNVPSKRRRGDDRVHKGKTGKSSENISQRDSDQRSRRDSEHRRGRDRERGHGRDRYVCHFYDLNENLECTI